MANSFIVDYLVHGGAFTSPETLRIFSENSRLQLWLDVETTLAKCQAELGIIPKTAAQEIEEKAKIDNFDLDLLRLETVRTKHSLVPLLSQLQSMCSEETARFIHWGATTQDIQDSAQSLELKEILEIVTRLIKKSIATLAPLARQYKSREMVGRTHSMPASPITLGLKISSWIDELCRTLERINESKSRICAVQLFGSVGTAAGLGPQSLTLIQLVGERLGLTVPSMSWHVSRDRVAEFTFLLSMSTSTYARIADEIRVLNRPEIGEIEVCWRPGEVGSSCMPQKHNPEECEQIVTLARLSRAQVALSLEAMILEHERDYRGTRLEWPVIMSVCHYAVGAAHLLNNVVATMRINEVRIEENVSRFGHHLCAENLTLHLSRKIGHKVAFATTYSLYQEAISKGINIIDYARDNQAIRENLTEAELAEIFVPRHFIGDANKYVDRVLKVAASIESESL